MNAIVAQPPPQIEAPQTSLATTPTPSDLLRLAIDKGADLDRLERLMDLQAKWEAGQARKAFTSAMTAFKARPLTIRKDKHVSFTTQKGKTEYDHATLAEVVDTVVCEMARHGLSHRWNVEQRDAKVIVTCVVTHELGHSESVQMMASADESGGKNSIQAIASTVTYLQRYTLMAACGLAARDMQDDDGRGSGRPSEPKTISQEQYEMLSDLMRTTGTTAEDFLRYLNAGVESISELPPAHFPRAKSALEAKAAKQARDAAK